MQNHVKQGACLSAGCALLGHISLRSSAQVCALHGMCPAWALLTGPQSSCYRCFTRMDACQTAKAKYNQCEGLTLSGGGPIVLSLRPNILAPNLAVPGIARSSSRVPVAIVPMVGDMPLTQKRTSSGEQHAHRPEGCYALRKNVISDVITAKVGNSMRRVGVAAADMQTQFQEPWPLATSPAGATPSRARRRSGRGLLPIPAIKP